MAVPKIIREEEAVLLVTGLLKYPLSPMTLQEMALLDGPPSPSDALIPACERLSLAPFLSPSTPKPEMSSPVPANPMVEQGSDEPSTHNVLEVVAPTSLTTIDPSWESLPKIQEVTTPSIIEFRSYEKEELDPSTGFLTRTRVIYPVVILKENNNPCISVLPLSATIGQVNSFESCPLTSEPDDADGKFATTTTPHDPPTPTTGMDPGTSSSGTPPEDVIALNDVVLPACLTPVFVSDALPVSPMSNSTRITTPRLLTPSADAPRDNQSTLVPLQKTPPSSRVEEAVEEEGQFDNVEVKEIDKLSKLHPSEQPLPSSPSPSPVPSPSSLSLVDRMVEHILQRKPQVSETNIRSKTPDKVATTMSPTGVPLYSPVQDHDNLSPMDTSTQEVPPNVLDPSGCDDPSAELPPLKYIPLPPNAGRGTLIKQLFAPRGAFAAPSMVCPSPMQAPPSAVGTTSGLSSLPPLLSPTYIRPMTIEPRSSRSPPPLAMPIQAALDQVTSPQWKQTPCSSPPIPENLSLPKPYSVPLPRTSPVTPVLDKPVTESIPSPVDSENDLPLNSIPVAELLNAHLSKDVSLMPIFISGPGFQGMATKLLVSTPKQPRRRYGCSCNQRRRAAHARAREELVRQLQNAADNRFCDWLGLPNVTTDEEVASLLAHLSTERSTHAPTVHTPLGLTSPSHLYRSPLPPNNEHMSKYDVESEWMDSASDDDQGLSPSPGVQSHSSAFRPIKPRTVCATGPATSDTSPLSRVEGQPSCDGQVLHAPLGKCVEGHPHCDWELDLRNHPHPQKYARSVAPSVATFEFTDVRSREPYVYDRAPTPLRLRCAKALV